MNIYDEYNRSNYAQLVARATAKAKLGDEQAERCFTWANECHQTTVFSFVECLDVCTTAGGVDKLNEASWGDARRLGIARAPMERQDSP